MNVSKNTAQAVLDSLIKKGFIHSVDTDFIVTAYRVDLDLIESFSVSETGTVPKTGTPQKSQEKQGSTGISNQESVPKTGTLENKKINNINKLANKNT